MLLAFTKNYDRDGHIYNAYSKNKQIRHLGVLLHYYLRSAAAGYNGTKRETRCDPIPRRTAVLLPCLHLNLRDLVTRSRRHDVNCYNNSIHRRCPSIVPVARYSACEHVWRRWEQPVSNMSKVPGAGVARRHSAAPNRDSCCIPMIRIPLSLPLHAILKPLQRQPPPPPLRPLCARAATNKNKNIKTGSAPKIRHVRKTRIKLR